MSVCVRACIFMHVLCVNEFLSVPLQPDGFSQTFQSARPNRDSLEPLKSVINKMVKGTCVGSNPGWLL